MPRTSLLTRSLSADFAETTLGPLVLSNNIWGVDTWGFAGWVNGVDYYQRITYHPGDLAHDIRVSWSYANPGGNILAYPALVLGYKPWSQEGDPFLIGQVAGLRELAFTTDIDIRGQTGGFNIAYDLWLTNRPSGGPASLTAEIMVWLHPGDLTAAGTVQARMVTDDFSASVYVLPDMQAGTAFSWAYIAVVIDGGQLDGRLDMAEILQFLARHGFIDRNDYLSSAELGAEIQTGTGGFTLNSFSWQHSAYHITNGADRLIGTSGDDRITGRGGADHLSGMAGKDWLLGGEGRDRLAGGFGDDTLAGGLGADRLTGGAGADHFAFGQAMAAQGDRITDFSRAEGDRIDLRGFDTAWHFIGNDRFHNQPGALRFSRMGDDLRLAGDIDGDGRANFALILAGVSHLAATDLVL